jgi:CBS-domain-containing membrane protein
MLRHLGAVYYQALQEEAAAAEVARAVDAVTELLARRDRGTEASGGLRHRGRWRVCDVMTADVVTADRNMSYKQAAKLLTGQRMSAVPVVAKGGRVVAVVSEADVLRKAERRPWRRGGRPVWPGAP